MQTGVNNSGMGIVMLMSRRLKHGRKASFTLHMTPMIDIIFLLLTFFVLTSNFRVPEDFLSIRLPSSTSQAGMSGLIEPFKINISAASNGCVVTIGNGLTTNELLIRNESLESDLAVFAGTLSPTLKSLKRNSDDPVEITCQDNIKWDHLVKIYNIINAMGLTEVTFNLND